MPVQLALSFGLGLYLFIYAFEAPVRWLLNMAHADNLIFIRDVMLEGPVAIIFVQQFIARKVHPAYVAFLLLLLLHGTVSMLNIRSPFVVIYSAKIFSGDAGGSHRLVPSVSNIPTCADLFRSSVGCDRRWRGPRQVFHRIPLDWNDCENRWGRCRHQP